MKNAMLAMLLGIGGTLTAQAGEVKVNWEHPEKYTDIRPSHETRAAFQDKVTKELGEVFKDLHAKLPEGVIWEITVTDVDLAGDLRPGMRSDLNEIRVIKEIYWPRMSITYKMTDASGKVLAQGKEDIKDMNFMTRSLIPSGHTSFTYEEKMLRDWFKQKQADKTFPGK